MCTKALDGDSNQQRADMQAPVLHRTIPGGFCTLAKVQDCGCSLYRCQVPMRRWQALFQTFLWLKSHKPHHSESQRAEQLQGWFPGGYSAAQAASLGLSAAGINSWGWNLLLILTGAATASVRWPSWTETSSAIIPHSSGMYICCQSGCITAESRLRQVAHRFKLCPNSLKKI